MLNIQLKKDHVHRCTEHQMENGLHQFQNKPRCQSADNIQKHAKEHLSKGPQ